MKLIPVSIRIREFSIAIATLITLTTKSQMIGAPATRSVVPKLWDEDAIDSMTLPAAIPGNRILYVSADYYYSIPAMPAWKSYPVYAPGKEPAGYLESLKQREAEKIFDVPRMKTQNDWIKAGRVIFDTPYELTSLDQSPVRDREWFEKLNPPLAKDGTITAYRYVIRERGKIEVGGLFCGSCHSRVMPDGSVIKGAQGNFPMEQSYAYELRKSGKLDRKLDSGLIFPELSKDDLNPGFYKRPLSEVAEVHETMVPGVVSRPGFSIFDMPKIADLIGVKDRKYLDLTARLEQRSIGDLMRYAAFCPGGNYFFSSLRALPEGEVGEAAMSYRPSDEQLYALARYVYSLKPPPKNSNLPKTSAEKTLVKRGHEVFDREDCSRCHKPPLYTNNKLTPAGNFQIPAEHRDKYKIKDIRVGTDERSATVSVRGRGYYKVPSLLGVWYRGPFEHNGSVATLEDWFDERRLNPDYVPTGFKGYGVKRRAVKGHEFGLDLPQEDKQALIAFLKTL